MFIPPLLGRCMIFYLRLNILLHFFKNFIYHLSDLTPLFVLVFFFLLKFLSSVCCSSLAHHVSFHPLLSYFHLLISLCCILGYSPWLLTRPYRVLRFWTSFYIYFSVLTVVVNTWNYLTYLLMGICSFLLN